MNLNELKTKCRQAKIEEEAEQKRYNKLKWEQEKFKNTCYRPLWKKKHWYDLTLSVPLCRVCGKPLNVEMIKEDFFDHTASNMILYCDCGYEYVWWIMDDTQTHMKHYSETKEKSKKKLPPTPQPKQWNVNSSKTSVQSVVQKDSTTI